VAIPSEVLKKVKNIEISIRKKVNNLFAGEYHTVFKGQGMTFADFREYVPGDDFRAISWQLTARTGKTYIKQFEEERELMVTLAVDVSGSVEFGSKSYLKGEIMTFIAAALGMSAVKNKDQVGLLLFTDQVEHVVPAKKGRNQIMRILRDLEYFKPENRQTDIRSALIYLNKTLKKRGVVFLISDFYSAKDYSQELRLLAQKHEVIACILQDPFESEIPSLGLVEFEDLETGETVLVDTAQGFFQKNYKKNKEEQRQKRDRILKLAQVDKIVLGTDQEWDKILLKYFKQRKGQR